MLRPVIPPQLASTFQSARRLFKNELCDVRFLFDVHGNPVVAKTVETCRGQKEAAVHAHVSSYDHPNVCRLAYAAPGPTANHTTLVMEYAGETLYALRKQFKGDEKAIRVVAFQLLSALAYLHDKAGVVHHDIKTANVMLNRWGRVCVIDFGLADKMANGISWQEAPTVATTNYRPPEMLVKATSSAHGCSVDMWSVGCVLAELYTGDNMFNGNNPDAVRDSIRTRFENVRCVALSVAALSNPK